MCMSEVEGVGLLWGSTYAESLVMVVPRVLRPSKPTQLWGADMILVMESLSHIPERDGLGTPIMEAWIDFSYAGVGLAFLLLGCLARCLWHYRLRYRDSSARLGLYIFSMLPFFYFETHSTFGLLFLLRLPLTLMAAVGALDVLGVFRVPPGRAERLRAASSLPCPPPEPHATDGLTAVARSRAQA
jgi:hypothetical protein